MCVRFQAVGVRLYFRLFNAQSTCIPLAGACSVRILSTTDTTSACEDIELEAAISNGFTLENLCIV